MSFAHATRNAERKRESPAPALQGGAERPQGVLRLQRLLGNREVSRLIQAKLEIGAVDDPLEHEAERVADRVTSAPSGAAPVQREMEGADAVHPVPARRAPTAEAADETEAGAEFERGLGATKGGGSPLPREVRRELEPRMGYDFGGVRIHRDGEAARLSRQIGARAFTQGRDIYFGAGEYAPETGRGKRLIAHELAHVVQQSGDAGPVRRLIRTPYPWRGVITPAIGANLRSARDSSDPTNILFAIPRGQPVTVLSATGGWLEVESRYRGPAERGWMFHTLVDDAASAAMGATVGTTMVWKPSGPGRGTDFGTWASAPTEAPFPAVTSSTVMNCWEAVLLAAHRSGAISWNWIHNLYTATPVANWVAAMSRGARTRYNVPGPNPRMPQRGDLVFFDGLSHVALATGSGSDVYTFWPPPNTPFAPGGTTDQVKVFTIEALVTWWTANLPPAPVVEFAAPSW